MSDQGQNQFERSSHTRQAGIVAEFVGFLRQNRKLWLVPLLLTLFAVGALIILGATAAAPFIYTLF